MTMMMMMMMMMEEKQQGERYKVTVSVYNA